MKTTLLIIAILSTGLMAGLFYSWSISVTTGLAKLTDENYLRAFQSMNRAIINPAFLIVFMGLTFMLPLLSYLYYQIDSSLQFKYILSATLFYVLGVIAVTILGNIPLNNSLEALKIDQMSLEQMKTFRQGFEKPWNKLNMIRTFSSALAFACKLIGLECKVFMVRISFDQKPFRKHMMSVWGANCVASPSEETQAGRNILKELPDTPGSLGIAISEAVEQAVTDASGKTRYALVAVSDTNPNFSIISSSPSSC